MTPHDLERINRLSSRLGLVDWCLRYAQKGKLYRNAWLERMAGDLRQVHEDDWQG